MKEKILFTLFLIAQMTGSSGQNYSAYMIGKDSASTFIYDEPYQVEYYDQVKSKGEPKNIILMIGDGMGIAHVFAGLTANKGHLYIENFKTIGYSKTSSTSDYVTDSGAGGTALSTGHKTYNGAIGMIIDANGDTIPALTILEKAESLGMATGLVSTCAMSHATPASFIAHKPSRNMYDDIAADYLKTDIDVFIGGGSKNFNSRKDGRDLTVDLKEKGYQVLFDMEEIASVNEGKLAGLLAFAQNKPYPVREMDLPLSTETAIRILSKNKKGFFMMVEGSQIDWASHKNNTPYVLREMLQFDKAIGKALEFAAKDKNTLVIVTADHETGGLAVVKGDPERGMVTAYFSTGGHTALMVPVFSFGPGSDNFTGIQENDEIGRKLFELIE